MNESWVLQAGFLCVLLLTIISIISPIIKYRKIIIGYCKKHNVFKFIVTVILPFLLPFILSIIFVVFEAPGIIELTNPVFWCIIVSCIICLFNFYYQFVLWKKEHDDKDIEWRNNIYRIAYDNLYNALKSKSSAYRKAAININQNKEKKQTVIDYDIFESIRSICEAFRVAMANISNIPMTNINASFVYHYTYKTANPKDRAWRWIKGKESCLNIALDKLIDKKESLYHYLINNRCSYVFYNNKRDAISENRYFVSDKDALHNNEGSIMAFKFSFATNAHECCEAIMIITTYSYRFIKNESEHSAKEFEKIILHNIFPCYKNMLKTELGALYFRHSQEVINKGAICNRFKFKRGYRA